MFHFLSFTPQPRITVDVVRLFCYTAHHFG